MNEKFEGGRGEREIRGTNEGRQGSKKFGARMRADRRKQELTATEKWETGHK